MTRQRSVPALGQDPAGVERPPAPRRSARRLLAASLAGVALAVLAFTSAPAVLGQSPGPAAPGRQPDGRFGFGRPATEAEIAKVNIDVRPDGAGMPPGSGTPAQGQALFTAKCAGCHGPTGREGGAGPVLVDRRPWWTGEGKRTIGNYWPDASTVYDYVSRAMPPTAPGSLQPDEVYALTAYVLHANEIIPDDAVIDAQTLPRVALPNLDRFITDPRPDVR